MKAKHKDRFAVRCFALVRPLRIFERRKSECRQDLLRQRSWRRPDIAMGSVLLNRALHLCLLLVGVRVRMYPTLTACSPVSRLKRRISNLCLSDRRARTSLRSRGYAARNGEPRGRFQRVVVFDSFTGCSKRFAVQVCSIRAVRSPFASPQ